MNLYDIPSLFFSKGHHGNSTYSYSNNNTSIVVFGSTIVLTFEKCIVTSLLIIISFLFLRKRLRLSHDRFSAITALLKRKFLHLIKGFSPNDYNDEEDNETTILQKQFEEAWPTIRMSSYRSLVLPPSCRKVTWKNRDGDSRNGTMTKSRDVIWESLKRLSLSARKISVTKTTSESNTDNTNPHEPHTSPPPPPPLSSPPSSPPSTPFSSPLQQHQQPRRFPRLATIFHKPNSNATTEQDMNFFDAETSTRGIQRLHRTAPVPDRHGYILGDEFLPSSTAGTTGSSSTTRNNNNATNSLTTQKQQPYTPLLVFVNTRSGPQQGLLVLHQLRRLLNPIQVWDLGRDGPPETILSSFISKFARLRLVVCGGDGTVSWILSSLERLLVMEEYSSCKWPPMAIVPLGTGNDLARVHGWGGGYSNENLMGVLERIDGSYVSLLDRWELEVDVQTDMGGGGTTTSRRGKMAAATTTRRGRKRNGMNKRVVTKAFTNYLGVGVDAQTAFQVHMLRESKPNLFFSRIINKVWYFIAGAEDFMNPSCTELAQKITLYADGVEIPIPVDSQGIIFLNIDSYAGGVPLWRSGESLRRKRKMKKSGSCPRLAEDSGDFPEGYGLTYPFNRASCSNLFKYEESMERSESAESLDNLSYTSSTTSSTSTTPLTNEQKLHNITSSSHHPSSCQDGMLDVVSIRGTFHLGQIRMGLGNAQRICQCRTATIQTKQTLAVHVDGEPWKQSPCTLTIRRKKDPASMLHCGAGRIYDYTANGRGRNGGNGDGDAVAVMAQEVSRLLDWAEETKVIDKTVHGTLMREFSRRVETMEGERRDRRRKKTAQEQLMIKLRQVLKHDDDF